MEKPFLSYQVNKDTWFSYSYPILQMFAIPSIQIYTLNELYKVMGYIQ